MSRWRGGLSTATIGPVRDKPARTGDVALPADLDAKLKAFFDKMDADSNGEVSKEEAVAFWGKNFAKVNAQSMFNEVDEDGNGNITCAAAARGCSRPCVRRSADGALATAWCRWPEFRAFWQNVVGSGYSVEDLMEEVDMMLEGGSWVDWNDGRTT